MVNSEVDVFVIAEDPPLINFFAFEIWLDGLTAEEATFAITNLMASDKKESVSLTTLKHRNVGTDKLSNIKKLKQFFKKSNSKQNVFLSNNFQHSLLSTQKIQNIIDISELSLFSPSYCEANENLDSLIKENLTLSEKSFKSKELKKENEKFNQEKIEKTQKNKEMKDETKTANENDVDRNSYVSSNNKFQLHKNHNIDNNDLNTVDSLSPYSLMMKNIVKFLCFDLTQQFHMFDLLHRFLKNPEGFITFSTLQIRLSDKRLLIRKYYDINNEVIKEILKQKRPLAVKQRSIRMIAQTAGVRVLRAQTQLDNLRRVWKWLVFGTAKLYGGTAVANINSVGLRKEKIYEEITTKKQEKANNSFFRVKSKSDLEEIQNKQKDMIDFIQSDNNNFIKTLKGKYRKEEKSKIAMHTFKKDYTDLISLCNILGYKLAMHYFRICWLIQHKIEVFTKRTTALNYHAVDRFVEMFMDILSIKTLDIPSKYVDFSKTLKNLYRSAKLQEEIRLKISLTMGVHVDGGLMQGVMFGRNTEALKINNKLKSFFTFLFAISSAQELSKFFVYLVDLIDKQSSTYHFFDACSIEFKAHLSDYEESLSLFVISICHFLKSVCVELRNDLCCPQFLVNSEDFSK